MNSFVKFVDEAVKEFMSEDGFKQSAKARLKEEPGTIWNKRDNEPAYARLSNKVDRDINVYDQPIDLIALVQEEEKRETSLYINGNPAVGENPNRNKQHGFYFNADNCIGCHACESACAEKNETPSHLAFRSVGFLEGGSYPDFQRLNISMACNHCDDPVCLKGCPTGAYIKHTEYGAVLQDPETCFGCGYCTWVCPYNAPQLDPVEGQVSKCNMCVDRLEVGLKPACVSACVGNALDFGVVDTVPDNREQAKTAIPGFPDTSITQPNIRFEQKRKLPEEMARVDSAPIKYHLDQESGKYLPGVDPKHGDEKQWNLRKLNSRENPLVIFTLSTQAAVGALVLGFLGSLFGWDVKATLQSSGSYAWLPFLCAVFGGIGLFMSSTHLGKPMRFYRGFNNLRYSPVSREALGISLFFGFVGMHWLMSLIAESFVLFDLASNVFAILAMISGVVGLYYMVKCYRIPARPFWNHWQTATSFAGTAIALGSVIIGVVVLAALPAGEPKSVLLSQSLIAIGVGVLLELAGLYFHAKHNVKATSEAAASHYVLTTSYGKTNYLRYGLAVLTIVAALVASGVSLSATLLAIVWSVVALGTLVTFAIGRAIFYVLVIPTTMPGAFFWRNQGFAEHAKETGLIDVVDAGIVRSSH